jgi:hypothetical protein
MKLRICAIAALAGLLFTNTLHAQEDNDSKKKRSRTLTISNKGISLDSEDSTGKKKTSEKKDKEKAGRAHLTFAMLDLGFNMLNDNTVYTDPTVVNYMNVPASDRNANVFDLKNGKSINVNIYPLMVKMPLVKNKNEKLYVSTGIGLQIYNFRYENPVTYLKNPNSVVLDNTVTLKKNKLSTDYVSIPLMITSKTRFSKKNWLVYGVGATAGYRLTSWNKQVSSSRGKVKTHGNFDMADYNTCLTAEFGVEGIIRFYGSYQLTSLYNNGIDQRPISVGIRIGGI